MYEAAWRDLSIRMWTFWCVWIGGFAGLGILGALLHSNWWTPAYGAGYFTAFLWSGARWSRFPCPRCGKQFFRTGDLSINQVARQCGSCGLKKWSDGS